MFNNNLVDLLLKTKKELETGKTNAVNAFYKIKGAAVNYYCTYRKPSIADDFVDSYYIDLRGFIYNLGNPTGAIDDDKSVNRRINLVANVWYGDITKSTRGRVLSHLDNTLVDPLGVDGGATIVLTGDLINLIKNIIGGLELC